jgi:hypothetical protein
MTKEEVAELKKKLNVLYDKVEQIDAQIDLLVLDRRALIAKIESGLAAILKYGDEEVL